MGKHQLREDKTCLNCRHVVERRYCPNCGQENTDSRKTFHHLFIHFFEDLTHYENAFWKTIRNLLFRPGSLTREYLSGKRLSYLAPVRLYIFISFVTFLLMGILPHKESKDENNLKFYGTQKEVVKSKEAQAKESKQAMDTLRTIAKKDGLEIGDYKSIRQFDSIQNALPEAKKVTGLRKWAERRLASIRESTTPEEFREKFTESIVHNIPKALFLYMPFFAFFIWLFHDKKRWYYFDSGIFTLHYFSFILLTLTIYLMLDSATSYISEDLNSFIAIFVFIMMIWWFFYFFRSHRRFYEESKLVSRLKSFGLFVINMFFLIFFMVGLMLYTALNIH
ncbi:MAG TPA: DUF3667 domain-containing protein [Flavobacterium sp.]|nr:DUF3667 domain-containing protein [Flavobacterium sp.]